MATLPQNGLVNHLAPIVSSSPIGSEIPIGKSPWSTSTSALMEGSVQAASQIQNGFSETGRFLSPRVLRNEGPENPRFARPRSFNLTLESARAVRQAEA